MIKDTFLFLIVLHVLCDFYFQTETMAVKKQTELKWVFYHSILYGMAAALIFWFFMPGLNGKYVAFFCFSHGVIDVVKYFCKLKLPFCQNERNLFLADQALHVFVAVMIVYGIRNLDLELLYCSEIREVLRALEIPEKLLLVWTARLLLIHKPINMLITHILSFYKQQENNGQNANDKNAGRFIGTLERIIICVFISLNQFSVIGLVLTAKSIARYDRITAEPYFAEYYLLGTLLSTIGAVCVSVLI